MKNGHCPWTILPIDSLVTEAAEKILTATGGVMVLGILAGRTDPTQPKKPMKDLTFDFITQFQEKFGGLSCGCLNPYENGSPEQKENCYAITAGAAAWLMKFIEDRGQ